MNRHSARWVRHALVDELSKAARLSHSGRSFLAHLVGTHRILVAWRMPPSVCAAGLLHSAYSTQFYPHSLLAYSDRNHLREIVGQRAEYLIACFCNLDRKAMWKDFAGGSLKGPGPFHARRLDGTAIPISPRTLRHLVVIESANVAEQSRGADGGPVPWMARVLGWWRSLGAVRFPIAASGGPALAYSADAAAVRAYRHALTHPAEQARAHLDRAIRANPWAAEPKILRAACAERRERAASLKTAEVGTQLLKLWAVSWDQRMTYAAWLAVAARVRDTPDGTETYEAVRSVLARGRQPPPWMCRDPSPREAEIILPLGRE